MVRPLQSTRQTRKSVARSVFHCAPALSNKVRARALLRLTRFRGNPIIAPRQDQDWEAGGTFNPGAIDTGESIQLLYRAVDANGVSRLGYARTLNGTEISFRSSDPVLEPSADWEEFGCEDPRITRVDGTFYVTYTAYSKARTADSVSFNERFPAFREAWISWAGSQ